MNNLGVDRNWRSCSNGSLLHAHDQALNIRVVLLAGMYASLHTHKKWYKMRKANESSRLNGHVLFGKIIVQLETPWNLLFINLCFFLAFYLMLSHAKRWWDEEKGQLWERASPRSASSDFQMSLLAHHCNLFRRRAFSFHKFPSSNAFCC